MKVNRYPALAAFIIRLAALAMFVIGVGTMAYWLLYLPRLTGNGAIFAMAGAYLQVAFASGGSWLAGGVILFACSRPLGKLVGYGL